MKLDLERIFEIDQMLRTKQEVLDESGIYINLDSSHTTDFEYFLEYYSFKISGDTLIYYNDDAVPYEGYTNSEFHHLPLNILSKSNLEISFYIENLIKELQDAKISEKQRRIEYLESILDNTQKELTRLKSELT